MSVREARIAAGYRNQTEAAKVAGHLRGSPVSQKQWSRWESMTDIGKARASTVKLICLTCDCDPEDLE